MLQVASFALPDEQGKANKFLSTHKPVDKVHFNTNMIIVFWDDGRPYPPECEIADHLEYVQSMQAARFQQEVSVHVMKADLADKKAGSPKWQEINSAIIQTESAIANQDLKIAFVEERIKQLKGDA